MINKLYNYSVIIIVKSLVHVYDMTRLTSGTISLDKKLFRKIHL